VRIKNGFAPDGWTIRRPKGRGTRRVQTSDSFEQESWMAKANKQSSRRRKQDRTRVAGGHVYDTRYQAPEDWPLEVAREESRQEIWE
jgi:hypothetical protein